MAVLGGRYNGHCGWDNRLVPTEFGFYVNQTTWTRAHRERWSGFVYVLLRDKFHVRGGSEWRSFDEVEPVDVLAVEIDDLPIGIKVFDDETMDRMYDEGRQISANDKRT